MGTFCSSHNFSQSQETDLSKRKMKGMKEINFGLNCDKDVEGRVDYLVEKLKVQKGYKIKLILATTLYDDATTDKFFKSIEKINNEEIYYLQWILFGNYSDQKSSLIGDLIGKFIHLYSLDLKIYGGQFEEQGLLSLARCFKNLQNLHVLKLDRLILQDKLIEQEKKMEFLSAIQEVKTLETLDKNIDINWQIQPIDERQKDSANVNDSFNNLSAFVYQIDISRMNFGKVFNSIVQEQMLDSLKKNLVKNKNKISKIIFIYKIGMSNGKYRKQIFKIKKLKKGIQINKKQLLKNQLYSQSLASLFYLPYLTSFLRKGKYENLDDPQLTLLEAFLKEKEKNILEIIVFHFDISKLFSFSPQWALNDLYFD